MCGAAPKLMCLDKLDILTQLSYCWSGRRSGTTDLLDFTLLIT